ncbi:hypothetical protein EWM64_g8006 [Hericium alpestre]|uniref:Uncharacterized protein n=1 Tax=Hericium alpestre TaxID=135208 RepID=A0A4Y9ZN17_9AGAM|nr:hypothetical protein EWM64_g8006 [Hericium alpestre]
MNWRKTLGMSKHLLHALKDAVFMLAKQQPLYDDLKQLFPLDVVDSWDQMIIAWDQDKSNPNPYEEPIQETSLADVRLELARDEA